MPVYLATKEMLRNRGRFFLFCLVIALITTLVLFVAGLAEGLGSGNREYIEKLNADLIVYKSNVDLSIGASRMDRSKLAALRRVEGVADAGPLSFTSVAVVLGDGVKTQSAAMIGVEPGRPGEPTVVQGRQLKNRRNREAILDRALALRTGYTVGDMLLVKTIQGTKEKFYEVEVVGLTDGRQYFLQPALIVPDLAWNEMRPGAIGEAQNTNVELASNVVALQLKEPAAAKEFAVGLATLISDVQAVDRQTAYEAAPGYTAQQSTLNTQQAFALIIGVLVIGGFFQIQTLQKVPQIGMLKAIGAPNQTIALAAICQIVLVTLLGVLMGSAGTWLLSLSFPAGIPIVFSPSAIIVSIIALLLIGPLGGLVSIRYSLRVEPLAALGLSS